MVFRVRDKFDFLRPVNSASSASDFGSDFLIVPSSSRFFSDNTLTRLSVEGNQTFGSPGPGFSSPRAMAIVRAFMSAYDATSTFRIFITQVVALSEPRPLPPRSPSARSPRPDIRKNGSCVPCVCDRGRLSFATRASRLPYRMRVIETHQALVVVSVQWDRIVEPVRPLLRLVVPVSRRTSPSSRLFRRAPEPDHRDREAYPGWRRVDRTPP